MPAEDSDTFNQRLSQWVASQGFWFQLRHSLSGGGSSGLLFAQLFRIFLRMLMLAGIGAFVFGVYAWRKPGTEPFRHQQEERLNAVLGAVETKFSGFSHIQGEVAIRRVISEGGRNSFFSSLDARHVKAGMSWMETMTGKRDLGVITIAELDLTLNAGADDEEGSKRIGDIVFSQLHGAGQVETIDSPKCSIHWGFSDRTLGKLVNSHVRIQRIPDGWRIQAEGGQFSQGFLKSLDLVELVAVCSRDGVVFDKLELGKDSGTVSASGLKVESGARPTVTGGFALEGLPMEGLLQPEAREWIDGTLTGEIKVGGSTNTEEGLSFDGEFTVSDESPLLMMDRIYLLRALTDFSVQHNFRIVTFSEGSFKLRSQGGVMEFNSVKLRGWGGGKLARVRETGMRNVPSSPSNRIEDSITLEGSMKTRLPSRQEMGEYVERNRAGEPVDSARSVLDNSAKAPEDLEITLRKAAEAARRDDEKATGTDGEDDADAVSERVRESFQTRLLQEMAIERQARTLIYEGGFLLSVPAEVFSNSPGLREMLPPDPSTGRISLQVPLGGDLYSLTHKQAEELYIHGERYSSGKNK